MDMNLLEGRHLLRLQGETLTSMVGCFEFISAEIRQNSVAILQGSHNFLRPILSLVCNRTPSPYIFVEHKKRTSISSTGSDPLIIIGKIHDSVLDSLLILSLVVASTKEMFFPNFSICFVLFSVGLFKFEKISIRAVFCKFFHIVGKIKMNDNGGLLCDVLSNSEEILLGICHLKNMTFHVKTTLSMTCG
jgi:hypothetical protein